MYGGGSNQASPLKQPPARRQPKKKPRDPPSETSDVTLTDSSAILRERKAQERATRKKRLKRTSPPNVSEVRSRLPTNPPSLGNTPYSESISFNISYRSPRSFLLDLSKEFGADSIPALMKIFNSYDRELYPHSPEFLKIKDAPSLSPLQRLKEELGISLENLIVLPVGSHEMAILGSGCGYLRKRGRKRIIYSFENGDYYGRCALTDRICRSSPHQEADYCSVFQDILEQWRQDGIREKEEYEQSERTLPLAEND